MSARVWRAIIRFSSVRTTQADTGEFRKRNARPMAGISLLIQRYSQPLGVTAHAGTNFRRILADAGRKDDGVEPAQGGDERAEFAPDPIDEQIDRFLGGRLAAREQRAHVAGNAGHAEQAGLIINQPYDRRSIETVLLKQIEDDAGIQRSRPGTHRQSVDRGQSHCARDAATLTDRAHAGAAPKMRHHQFAVGAFRGHVGQGRHDKLVRKTMKTIASYSPRAIGARQCERLGDGRLTVVKGGIETSNLRHLRRGCRNGSDGGDIVRLMERRERYQLCKLRQHDVIDQHRFDKGQSAMNDTVADSGKTCFAADMGGEPVVDRRDGTFLILGIDRPIGELAASRIIDPEMRRGSDALHLAMRSWRKRTVCHRLEDGKLDAR